MPEFINMTIGDWLDGRAKEFPDKDCCVHPYENLRFSTLEFKRECDRVARGLMAMGIKKGDHVAIWATNYPQWVQTQFATAKIGAVLVTVNTNYKKFELEYLLRQSDSKMLIMMGGTKDNDYVEHIEAVCPEMAECAPGQIKCHKLPFLTSVVFLDEAEHPGMYHWKDVLEMAEKVTEQERAARQAECDPHDVINMQYTSGTTGFPKGVMLTHYNLVNNGKIIGESMAFTENDRLCITVPLFHCFGCVLGVMASITNNTTMVFVDHFNPIKVLNVLDSEKCTAFHGVPTMYIAMLENPDFKKYDLSNLRTGIMAGSTCPVKVMKAAADKMNMRHITSVYGQTESSPGITQSTVNDPLEIRVSTVGRAYPNVEAKVIDPETGLDVPPNTVGEIFAFLNADDTYGPGALAAAATGFERNPGAAAVYGDGDYVDATGATVRPYPVEDFDRARLQHGCFVCQPAAFVRRDAWRELGGLDAELRYALDYDLWIRMSERRPLVRIPGMLATSRMHAENKTLGQRAGLYRESVAVVRRHFGYVPMSWLEQYARHLVDDVDQFYDHSIASRRSRALALALGLRNNPGQLRRFWRDWQTDGCTHRFRDGWMSKAHSSRHEVPPDARRLTVAGRHHAEVRRPLLLTVSAGERRLGRALIRHPGAFERSFAVPAELRGRACEVRVVSAWTWRPGAARGDTRRLSCLLDRVEFES